LRRAATEARGVDLERARDFAAAEAARHHLFYGCANITQYGRLVGFDGRRAREYAAAGRVIERHSPAAQALLSGVIGIEALAALEPLFTQADLRLLDEEGKQLDDAATLAWAAVRPEREIRDAVMRRKEEVRAQAVIVSRTLHLTRQGARDLERTRVLVSRSERRPLSMSEAAACAFREFVARHDSLERSAGSRRLPAMPRRADGQRHPRAIPAEVKRQLMRTYGDVCAIEGCDHDIWLENAHHVPHALGGGNELEDQQRICAVHHRMKDHGELRWVPLGGPDTSQGHYLTPEGRIVRLRPADGVRERAPPLAVSRARRRRPKPRQRLQVRPAGYGILRVARRARRLDDPHHADPDTGLDPLGPGGAADHRGLGRVRPAHYR
ncbi:MAG: hypothetical protein O2894_00450, partial [Planctomycetota bacterium]|nr:hypothetical protein [Planctomycetota bacterium]